MILADPLSQDNREWAGEGEVPVCQERALHCLCVLLTGTAPPNPPACHLPLGLGLVLELAEMRSWLRW